MSRRAKSRRPYRKPGDDELLALIHRLVDERPTYGYRRIRRQGPVGALTYRAAVDVPACFRNSKAVGAVLGLSRPSINRARSTEPAQSHGAETR